MGGINGLVWRALVKADRAISLARFGQPISEGYECLVFARDDATVRKQYKLQNFRSNQEFHRSPERTYLEGVESPHIVRMLRHGPQHLVLERLGAPLGDYAGITRVADPDALTAFLGGIEATLLEAGVRHHDIHPGNILYHPQEHAYKLIDFGWARRMNEKAYRLPEFINPHYTPDDHEAIERLKREADL